MNDAMFIALRAELQEANSLSKQILDELKRMNELLAQLAAEQTVFYPKLTVTDDFASVTGEALQSKLSEVVKSRATPKKGK